jgi:hypothetical protein
MCLIDVHLLGNKDISQRDAQCGQFQNGSVMFKTAGSQVFIRLRHKRTAHAKLHWSKRDLNK